MGIIRVLLALAVVIAHSTSLWGYAPIGPAGAVEAFYVISGFYMAMVLSQKYEATPQGTKLFYQNRYLRLAPTYWLACAGTLCIFLLLGRTGYFTYRELRNWIAVMQPSTLYYLVAINVTILGQDSALFTCVATDTGSLTWSQDPAHCALPAHEFLLLPQAWSIGIELMFYLIAPFLLRARTLVLVFVAAASLVLRVAMFREGLTYDPWTYRFFPSELCLFLLGGLAFRWYTANSYLCKATRLQWGALLLVIAGILALPYIPFREATKYPLFCGVFAAKYPFHLRGNQKQQARPVHRRVVLSHLRAAPARASLLLVGRFGARAGRLLVIHCVRCGHSSVHRKPSR